MSTKTDHRNRETRRHGTTVAPTTENKPLQIQYGHTGQLIVIAFGMKVENLMMSEVQIDAMVDAIQIAKAKLVEHRAAAAQQGGPGHA